LQRLAAGEAHQLRRFEPGRKEGGIVGLRIRESLELPAAVIDVVEVVARLAGGKAAGARDGRAGFDAALHRARVNAVGLPAAGDTARQRFRLHAPLLGERQRLPSAKSLGRDAFDMAVARE
jgi:hypothetical protein